MLTRRDLLMTPAALMAGSAVAAAAPRLSLALHQNTSSRAGYRASLSGWAAAGIRDVELTNALLDEFLKGDTLEGARRVLTDLGLRPVSGACGVTGLLDPGEGRSAAVEAFKRRCAQWQALGIPRIYATTASAIKPVADDYKRAAEAAREVALIAHDAGLTMMFEFVRNSTFVSTLPTLLAITRGAAQPNLGPLFDCYHFWSGLNKLSDLDDVRPGEIAHVHFQDVPAMPRELLDLTTREIPGDGVSPLVPILRRLRALGYAGSLSVELFLPRFTQGDPRAVAQEIQSKALRVMRQAGVA